MARGTIVGAALAGLAAAVVSLVAYFAYAAVAGPPDGTQSKAGIYVGMSVATAAVGAAAWLAGGRGALCGHSP